MAKGRRVVKWQREEGGDSPRHSETAAGTAGASQGQSRGGEGV